MKTKAISALILVLLAPAAAEVTVDVSSEDGDDLDGFDISVTGEDTDIFRQDVDEAELDLEEGEYDIEISRRNYRTIDRTVFVNEDGSEASYRFTMELLDDRFYEIDAETADGRDLDGLNITVQGQDTDRFLENVNRAQLTLEEGEYDIVVSKEGYRTSVREIDIEDDADGTVIELEPRNEIDLVGVDGPQAVCRGASGAFETEVRNRDSVPRVVSLSASKDGSVLVGKGFTVEPGETATYRFRFTGLEASGTVTVRTRLTDSEPVTAEIDVVDCESFGTNLINNIEFSTYSRSSGGSAYSGEAFRIKGFADGNAGRSTLELLVEGEKRGEINTERDGYFEEFIRIEETGEQEIKIRKNSIDASRTVEVLPSPEIERLDAPGRVFAGERFSICAEIDSETDVEAVLLQGTEVIERKNSLGFNTVCFDTRTKKPGQKTYTVRTLTYGGSDSSETSVDILPEGNQTDVFPQSVTVYRGEPGLVRVQLYNTGDSEKEYTVRMEDPEGIFEDSDRETALKRGEKNSLYFYIDSEDTGTKRPMLEVKRGSEEIYSRQLTVTSVRQDSEPGLVGLLGRYLEALLLP